MASIGSRVVPGISDTSARSSLSRRLSSVLFPTLGRPTIATATPSLMALPKAKESISRSIFAPIRSIAARSSVRSANSTSSSPKSSSSSSSEASRSNSPRSVSNSAE